MGLLTQRIINNHNDFVSGKVNYLPFNELGKITEWYPGLMRGEITTFTGTPASSKTALVKRLIVHDGITWAINNKKNFHVMYIGLEESELQFRYSLMSYQGFIKYNLQYNIKDFESIGRTINIKDIEMIEKIEERADKMMGFITYVTNTKNSYGIWKKVRDFAMKRGKFFLDGKEVHEFNSSSSWDTYQPDDPEEFVVIVLDHLLLVEKQRDEKDQAEAMWNTIENLRDYACRKLNYAVVIIHHQNADSENQESRRERTILPTENGLAVNKGCARSYLNLIGIANPNKVNVAGVETNLRVWDGHDLTKFGDYLRTINILKSRYGEVNKHDSVFFGGRTGYFTSIPKGDKYKEFVEKIKTFK